MTKQAMMDRMDHFLHFDWKTEAERIIALREETTGEVCITLSFSNPLASAELPCFVYKALSVRRIAPSSGFDRQECIDFGLPRAP